MATSDGFILLIDAVKRLEKTLIDTSKQRGKEAGWAKEKEEVVQVQVDLREKLAQAVSSPVIGKTLQEIVKRGFANQDVKESLAKASGFKADWLKARQQFKVESDKWIKDELKKVTKQTGLTAASPQWQAIQQQLQQMAPQQPHIAAISQQQQRAHRLMNVALGRGQQAGLQALPQQVTNFSGALSKASKISGYFGNALASGTKIVGYFNTKMKESGDIIARYSHYSFAGLHAGALMEIRDMRRRAREGQQLGGQMIQFARATSNMKDAWSGAYVVMNKFILSMGTIAANIGERLGNVVSKVSESVDEFMGHIKRLPMAQAIIAAGPVFGPIIKAVAGNWQNKQEQVAEQQKRIQQRKWLFANRQGLANNPQGQDVIRRAVGLGLLNPLEAQIMFGMGPQAQARGPGGRNNINLRRLPPGGVPRRMPQGKNEQLKKIAPNAQQPGGLAGGQGIDLAAGAAGGGGAVGRANMAGGNLGPREQRAMGWNDRIMAFERQMQDEFGNQYQDVNDKYLAMAFKSRNMTELSAIARRWRAALTKQRDKDRKAKIRADRRNDLGMEGNGVRDSIAMIIQESSNRGADSMANNPASPEPWSGRAPSRLFLGGLFG